MKIGEEFKEHEIILNGSSEPFSKRMERMLKVITDSIPEEGAKAWDTTKNEETTVSKEELLKMHFHVESVNNFPTASGVASSSSGLSCLALCLSKVYGCNMSLEEVSRLARLGSGSASRSLFGGFVLWDKGFDDDVKDADLNSKAIQVKSEEHWPDLC